MDGAITNTLATQVWSMDLQHWHHLGVLEIFRISGSGPNLLNLHHILTRSPEDSYPIAD